MASIIPPVADSKLRPFASDFSATFTASPATYLGTPAEATDLATKVTDYSTKLDTATDPTTRTRVSIAAKEMSKAILLQTLRSLCKRIQSSLTVTPDQKLAIGLSVHKTTQTPIPPPVTKPVVIVTANTGRTLTLALRDESTLDKKAKPFGVDGAEVYSYVPATPDQQPPVDLTQWRFEGIATRTTFAAGFDPDDVGKTAYVLARWFNPRGEPGPASATVNVAIAA